MTIIVLPIDAPEPHYSVDVELLGQLYRFKIDWNQRSLSWKMNLSLADDTLIIAGKSIKTNVNLFERHTSTNLPNGALFCIDTSGKELDPTRDSLGKEHILIFGELTS